MSGQLVTEGLGYLVIDLYWLSSSQIILDYPSEGFEDYYYKNDSDCTWIISGTDDLKISYEIAYLGTGSYTLRIAYAYR